jgi:hypothetical protein
MKETLKEILDRFQHLSDYAETKLGVLIAFNSALIFGLLSIYKDQSFSARYVIIIVAILNGISLFFAFSGVFAKRKNSHSSSHIFENKNFYYFKYVAQLNESTFLEQIKSDYSLTSQNENIEKHLSNQIVVLARNAERKFRLFNIAIWFTIASLITPLGLLIFQICNNSDWLS